MKRRAAAVPLALALALAPLPLRAQDASYVELQRLSGVLNHVRLNYVEDVTYAELVRGAIEGALATLDPHSSFFARADWQRLDALQRGELATIGAHLEEVDGRIVVHSLDPDGPAARAGIMPGDRILQVDSVPVHGLAPRKVELMLAGEEHARVRVRLERGPWLEPAAYEVRLRREMAAERSVDHAEMLDETTGYLSLVQFRADAAREVDRALRDLRDRGARGVILDLRGNPGGMVIQAANIAALFLEDDLQLFRTVGRKGDANEEYLADGDGRFRDLPLIVLIDEASASASEAVAASLQDHDRALLVGRRTFGKALVQAPFLLNSGDVVWLTVARVVSPSGRIIQRPYDGRTPEEYRADAGRDGADADAPAFRTAAGRVVRGGGGVRPDVELPARPELPAWWSAALERGIATAVADSVAQAHRGGRSDWLVEQTTLDQRLVEPFLQRVRLALDVPAGLSPEQRARIGRVLAERVVAATEGVEAARRWRLRSDPEVAAARALFPDLTTLLSPP